MSTIMQYNGFVLGERVSLSSIEGHIVNYNARLKKGDIGKIVCFHEDFENPEVTISWDRRGLGNTRTIGDREYKNCWAVSLEGISKIIEDGYNPLTWKIKEMFERQPYYSNHITNRT